MVTLAWYGLATLLVVAYVQTFAIWTVLTHYLGDSAGLVPWGIAALMAISALAAACRRPRVGRVSRLTLAAALAVAVIGLLIADPQYPAKRIHVPQYALLALVVWTALRDRVPAEWLVVGTIFVTGLFGVHDEFLQALHPDRFFGSNDILVNLSGGITGALALAGIAGHTPFPRVALTLPGAVAAGLAMSVIGLVLYVPALDAFRENALPYWSALPLLAGAFALACALAREPSEAGLDHIGTVIVLQLVALFAYPVVANETPLVFA